MPEMSERYDFCHSSFRLSSVFSFLSFPLYLRLSLKKQILTVQLWFLALRLSVYCTGSLPFGWIVDRWKSSAMTVTPTSITPDPKKKCVEKFLVSLCLAKPCLHFDYPSASCIRCHPSRYLSCWIHCLCPCPFNLNYPVREKNSKILKNVMQVLLIRHLRPTKTRHGSLDCFTTILRTKAA